MKFKLLILFIILTSIVKGQYFITINWTPTPTVTGYGALAASTATTTGTTYLTKYNFGATDVNGNPLYAFVPYTPGQFNDTDIVVRTVDSASRAASITILKSKAYKTLQGLSIGSTPTSAQQTAAFWVFLWNTGCMNYTTNKIDSFLNYIHP